MRRVLRQVAKNDKNIGDVTTMADSSVVDNLFENRPHVDFIHEWHNSLRNHNLLSDHDWSKEYINPQKNVSV